jgi:dTDP-D-glucose 4,6-dehydratase
MLDDNTFKLTEISTDETYGYSEKNAIMVGGVTSNAGPLNEQRFLNALLGPNGQK